MDWLKVKTKVEARRDAEIRAMEKCIADAVMKTDSFCFEVKETPPTELLENASRALGKDVIFKSNPHYMEREPHYTLEGNQNGYETDRRFGWIKTVDCSCNPFGLQS